MQRIGLIPHHSLTWLSRIQKEWEPDALRRVLIEFVECTGFDGIDPLPKELCHAGASARQPPQVVQY